MPYMAKSSRDHARQRVVNACDRCRHHKIKCSGYSPCTNCQHRKVSCVFAGEEAKVQITKRRLSELKRRNCEIERENLALQQRLSGKNASNANEESNALNAVLDQAQPAPTFSPPNTVSDDTQSVLENTEIRNLLSTGPPEFIRDVAGDPHYLGHTSNWSLSMRLLQLTHQTLYNCPYPSGAHHIDSMTYDFGWNGTRHVVIPDVRGLPSLDHALFLIKATDFHTGQMFHLFDERVFMPKLYWFYEDPAGRIHHSGLWFIHFLVLVALGKAFNGSKNTGNTPPGADLFAKAYMMLPDYCYLWKEPCLAGEILCSIALYLQSIDWRTSAHNMISQAQRILLVHGFHTNMNPEPTDTAEQARRRNIWWTVFILERRTSVLLGVPLGIRDQDIFTPLPNFPESQSQTDAAIIHVKLSKAFGQVVDTIYHGSYALGSNFVKITQDVLHDVANVASDLHNCLPVPESDSMNGISRLTGYMNLLYHECIILSTRPFLFNLVERCVRHEVSNVPVPVPIKALIEICIESARKTAYVLEALMSQCILDCFLPFHLESAVSAGLVITMATSVNLASADTYLHTLQTLFRILDKMVHEGNLVAINQKNELGQLQDNCALLRTVVNMPTPNESIDEGERSQNGTENKHGTLKPAADDNLLDIDAGRRVGGTSPFPTDLGQDEFHLNSTFDMSSSQLMSVVDMLNTDDLLDWVTFPTP